VVETICAAFGTDWRPSHVPLHLARLLGKSGDLIEKLLHASMPINSDRVRKLSRPLTFSCEKAKRVLEYEPVETLQEGISKEVEWLITENAWK
jgi:nucleoside-diphosphate-sugar epimerase